MKVAKDRSRKTISKKCEHEGCEKIFETNKTAIKFCEEHQKKRKYIYEKNDDLVNQTINHNYKTAVKIISICETCKNEFEIILLPSVKKYPKFCEFHRNEYKRKLFFKNNC